MGIGYIVFLILIVVLGWTALTYNRLVKLQVRMEES